MSFSKQINKFTDKAADNMDKVVRMSFIEMSSKVIRTSPVGDANFWKPAKNGKIYKPPGYTGGRFRANWQASVNTPKTGAIDTAENPETGKNTSIDSVNQAVKIKHGNSYWLVNTLPYAKALEDGHSRQRPNGIVKLVTAQWKTIVRNVTKLVN